MGTHEAQGRAPQYTACTRCEANKAIPWHTHGKQTPNFRFNIIASSFSQALWHTPVIREAGAEGSYVL